MSEKMKMPQRAEREPEAELIAPPAAEQDILETLHAENERHHTGHHSKEGLGKLHQDIERCECYPMFKQYVSGEIPNLDRLFNNVKPFIGSLDSEIESLHAKGDAVKDEREALEKRRALLLGRETQIRGGIQRYVNSVIRFNRLNKLRLGNPARDLSKQFEDADHSRRRAHNDLLKSLTNYAELVRAMVDEGDSELGNFPFTTWGMGEDARTAPEEKAVIFRERVMQNRDFIRDWAIVADFHEQLRELGDDEWLAQKKNGDR